MKNLPGDVETLRSFIVELLEENKQLSHRLQILLRQRFGPSAEKIDPEQLRLFAEEVLERGDGEGRDNFRGPPEVITVTEHNRNGRRKLPADLPRLRIEHDVPEEEKSCPCCGSMRTVFGEETSEQLEYEPAKVYVIEHARLKYVCRRCEGEVITADKPRQPIEKCLAGPGLLAQVAVNKYADHQPLHRLERILRRHGADIHRSTMCDWMAGCASALKPLHRLMRDHVLQSAVVHTDDTPVPVQEKGRGKTRTGRFWVYVGDKSNRYAVFDYTPTRSREGPLRWLEHFQGHLQADAYAGYTELYTSGRVQEVACWAHARRKFYDARLTDPGRCHQALAWIRRLYEIEREGRDDELTHEELRELRQRKSVPLLNDFREWVGEMAREVLPKSPTAEAIRYVRSRWESFTRYTMNGILAIDNNLSERTIRCIALGRKNWLFAGSDRGGETAAILFSMFASCRLHEVEPYQWLCDVLRRIPDIRMSRLEDLLPDRWQANRAADASTA